MVGLAADVTEYVIVLNLFASRDKKAVCCFKTLYIFLYEWIIFADKMTFFRLSQEVNSKHMFVMVRVTKYVEMQISLSETHEGVKTKNKAEYLADMEGSKYFAQIAFLLPENNSKRSKILQI